MPTTFVNTIDDIVILAKRSQCDYAGNDIQTTYATKNELPTATSDLTNDSGFITSSDIPVKDVQVSGTSVVNAQGIAEISIPQTGVLDVEVDGSSVVNAQGVAEIVLPTFTQVNADWDATSGVSEILNKPDLSIYAESSDLATVATSGSYNDLLDKPSIPSAQVNADWDATSGVSEILNKPNLATVATTGDYSDLQNLPSIPAAQVNSDWDATSGVSQILNKPTIPSYTAGNGIDITSNVVSAKVDGTTIDTNASGELTVIGGGGGGSQVNSDWDATSGVAEILNKPTPKTLTAGPGISIADGVSTVTISCNVTAPVQDVTVDGTSVVSNGVAAITSPTVDQTYDASSTDAQSGVAVAEGISDAIGDLPTNLTSAQLLALKEALGVDETVLFNTNDYYGSATLNLSEPFTNFERLKVLAVRAITDQSTPYSFSGPWCEFETAGITINSGKAFGSLTPWIFENKFWKVAVYGATSTTQFTWSSGLQKDMTSTAAGSMDSSQHSVQIKTVIGVHRIASN